MAEAERIVEEKSVVEPAVVPPKGDLVITEAELRAAELTPRCIVKNHTYADVAQLVAPGGTGKTTLLLYELICIRLGRSLWGCEVVSPGWSLIVTAEDQRERLVARTREILNGMNLSETERARAIAGILIWDVTGEQLTLTVSVDGNLMLTSLADQIVEAFREDPPALVVFDPLVSFGTSEERVNTNEQALVLAARRIVRGLRCCVRYVHHAGKQNSREKTLDQYSGRGGSALADGSRMTFVLQTWEQGDKETPPPGCKPDGQSNLVILARPKLSYSIPNLPKIWIKRTGYRFEHFTELRATPEQANAARTEQLHQFLTWELSQGRKYTQNNLEHSLDKLNMTRQQLRAALSELQVTRRVVDADLPENERQGRKKTYLKPANRDGELDEGSEVSQ